MWRRVMLAALAPLCVASLASAQRRNVDLINDFSIGGQLGAQIGNALDAAARMRAAGADATAQIEEARRRYWAAVRSGGDVAAARAEFAHLLDSKDLYYIMFAVPEGIDGPLAVVINTLSGGMDRGIHPHARADFVGWVTAIRHNLGAQRRGQQIPMPNPARLKQAIDSSGNWRSHYVRARDWAEIDASGLTFPWHTDDRAYVLMIIQRYGAVKTTEQVLEGYRRMLTLVDEPTLFAAARRLRSAPRDSMGMLANPAAIGVTSTDPARAFAELWTASGNVYVPYAMAMAGKTVDDGKRIYQRLVWAYGANVVDSAAMTVQRAPTEPRFGELQQPITIGVPGFGISRTRHGAIQDLLLLRDTRGWVRAMVAARDDASSRAQVDAAYDALVRKYSEPRIIQAAEQLRDLMYTARYSQNVDARARYDEIMRQRSGSGILRTSDLDVLEQVLTSTAEAVLGDPDRVMTAEDRLLAEAAKQPPGWPREFYLLVQRWRAIQAPMVESNPAAIPWSTLAGTQIRNSAEYFRGPPERRAHSLPMDIQSARDLHDATLTLREKCKESGNDDSGPCQLKRFAEDWHRETWPLLPPGWRRLVVDGPTPRGASGLGGTWTAELVRRSFRYRMELMLEDPTTPGERVGISHNYGDNCVGEYFFVGVERGEYTFRDEIQPNRQRICPNGVVKLRRTRDDKLEWRRYDAAGQLLAEGVFTRKP